MFGLIGYMVLLAYCSGCGCNLLHFSTNSSRGHIIWFTKQAVGKQGCIFFCTTRLDIPKPILFVRYFNFVCEEPVPMIRRIVFDWYILNIVM